LIAANSLTCEGKPRTYFSRRLEDDDCKDLLIAQDGF
jgi:hypothetical protein